MPRRTSLDKDSNYIWVQKNTAFAWSQVQDDKGGKLGEETGLFTVNPVKSEPKLAAVPQALKVGVIKRRKVGWWDAICQ